MFGFFSVKKKGEMSMTNVLAQTNAPPQGKNIYKKKILKMKNKAYS